jgi:LemA protein
LTTAGRYRNVTAARRRTAIINVSLSLSRLISARREAPMNVGSVVFLVAVAAVVWFAVATYNRLVGLRQRSAEAWSDIDVQLKRRTDLVPNLVETVKGYAAHERTTLDQVVRSRNAAMAAATPEARARAEGQLTDALRQLFALAEAYPDLKANESFRQLQTQLAEIENAVQDSRRYYNAVVRDLNTAIESFPSNLVASAGRFLKRQYFELDRPEDRQVPRVSFGGSSA